MRDLHPNGIVQLLLLDVTLTRFRGTKLDRTILKNYC